MKKIIKEGLLLITIASVTTLFFAGALLLSNYIHYGTFTF